MEQDITWMLFDLTGVISSFSFDNPEKQTINDKEYIEKQLEAIYLLEEYAKYAIGEMSQEELFDAFKIVNDCDLTFDEFEEVHRRSIFPIAGMEDLLKRLHDRYKLAIVSNEGSEWGRRKLTASGLGDYFNEVIISGDIGVLKPNKEFFAKSLGIVGASPSECVFVDDTEENVKSAEELGITSILFSSAEEFKKALEDRRLI